MYTKKQLTISESEQDKEQSGERMEMYKNVNGTPFHVVRREDGYILVLGTQMVAREIFKSEEEAINHIKSIPWETLIAVVMDIVENYEKIKNHK